jgi:hypothetical protein
VEAEERLRLLLEVTERKARVETIQVTGTADYLWRRQQLLQEAARAELPASRAKIASEEEKMIARGLNKERTRTRRELEGLGEKPTLPIAPVSPGRPRVYRASQLQFFNWIIERVRAALAAGRQSYSFDNFLGEALGLSPEDVNRADDETIARMIFARGRAAIEGEDPKGHAKELRLGARRVKAGFSGLP